MSRTTTRQAEVPAPRNSRPPKADPEAEVPADLGEYDGHKIVREEQVANLPGAPFKGFVKVVLDDDREFFRCTDEGCGFIDTRGNVTRHRQQEHGQLSASQSRRRAQGIESTPPKYSDEVLGLTVAEILQYAQDRASIAAVVEDLTTQRDSWKDRALAAEMAERRFAAALDRIGFRRVDEEL